MMRALRDKKFMHAILWFVLVCFLVGFVFLVLGTKYQFLSNGKNPDLIAQIGDEQISNSDFFKTYQPALDKLYRAKQDNPTSDEIRKLKEQVLNRLIDETILKITAKKLDLSVPNEEILGWLQRQSYFLDENGKFDKSRYYQVLQANQMTPQQFEETQRNQILLQKIQSILTDGVLTTSEELKEFSNFLNRDLKADYVAMDLSAYEKEANPSTGELKEYYQTIKSQFDHPERAKIRHILISLQGNESIQDEQKAKASLEDYRKQILSKKSTFEDLARKYSQDGGSKDRGGDLGWVTRNGMGKDLQTFEDTVFKLKKNELSQPIKTKYGYHLVQLEDYEKEYKSTFGEVEAKVLKQYQREKATEKIMTLSEQLIEKLKEKESLEVAAKELGLHVVSTDWFGRKSGIPGLKKSTDLSDELATLNPSEWKGPLELEEKEFFFQVTDAKENPSSDAEDTEDLSRRLASYRQDIWLKDFLQDQRKKLNLKSFLNI